MAGTGLVGVNITPAGPVHSVFTVTGTSTAGLSSTVQVRVGEDPAMIISEGAGVTVTIEGAGAEGKRGSMIYTQRQLETGNKRSLYIQSEMLCIPMLQSSYIFTLIDGQFSL